MKNKTKQNTTKQNGTYKTKKSERKQELTSFSHGCCNPPGNKITWLKKEKKLNNVIIIIIVVIMIDCEDMN